MHLLTTLVGLAISFAVPAFAEEKAATPAVPNPFQPIPAITEPAGRPPI
jgi:hypothetical protein